MRLNGSQFYATINSRIQRKEDIDTSKLQILQIPRAHVYPIYLTQAPNSFSDEILLKTPSLLSYGDSRNLTEISSLFLHKAQMCERIGRSPQPNVAKYFGCHLDQHGLITGLCFKRYHKRLHQMAEAREVFDHPKCLSDIKAGIEHLHSLGVIHCDINPHNVMLDGSTFVIMDFDSCTFKGDELRAKAHIDEWTNNDFEFAQPENDWSGFEKIKDFLSRVKKPKSGLEAKLVSS
jgi:serine/threonine protein kinase